MNLYWTDPNPDLTPFVNWIPPPSVAFYYGFGTSDIVSGLAPISISLPASGQSTGFVFTVADFSIVGNITATYTVNIYVSVGDSKGRVSATLDRMSSDGTSQASSAATAEQTTNPIGIKTFTFTNLNLGTFVAGDRLRLGLTFRNSSTSQAAAFTIDQAPSSGTNFVAPWGMVTIRQTDVVSLSSSLGTVTNRVDVSKTILGQSLTLSSNLTTQQTSTRFIGLFCRLTNTGNLRLNNIFYSQFDEVRQANIQMIHTGTGSVFYAGEFDEVSNPANTAMRMTSTGNLQVIGEFDETTFSDTSNLTSYTG